MTGRFDYIKRRDAPPPEQPQRPPGLKHREAFCLMWYGCPCGHRERYWNSRDGVTPFGTLCPSCGEPSMQHIQWGLDTFAPDHKPVIGQRVWIDMSMPQAEAIARHRIAQARAAGRGVDESPEYLAKLAAAIYENGRQPALEVWGYAEHSA